MTTRGYDVTAAAAAAAAAAVMLYVLA